jgi:hypothetical protein
MLRRALILLLLLTGPGLAQPVTPPVENVTVTGARTRQAIEGFVQSLAVPTHVTGKIARWEDGICPTLVGLKREFAGFIVKRVKDVAARTGAPVNAKPDCAPNIAIVFTTAPQALIDNVKKKTPGLLGYYDNRDQLDKLATVTRPIQAWYTTATRDLRGNVEIDGGKTAGTGLDITYACGAPQEGMCTLHLSNAHGASVTGNRLGDGMRSTLYNVVIVANPDRLVDDEMGTLADIIAMLALAQVNTPDACQTLPSILNLLASGCAGKSNALTANDLGYLTALYRMSPDRSVQVQRGEMTYQMQQSLGVK